MTMMRSTRNHKSILVSIVINKSCIDFDLTAATASTSADGKSSVNQTQREDDHLTLKPGESTDNVFMTLLL